MRPKAFIPDPSTQLTGFLASRCILAPDVAVMPNTLYGEYIDYCCSVKQNWASKQALIRAMEQAGFQRRRTSRLGPHWVGIKVKPRARD